jgi:hypothetical protein
MQDETSCSVQTRTNGPARRPTDPSGYVIQFAVIHGSFVQSSELSETPGRKRYSIWDQSKISLWCHVKGSVLDDESHLTET